MTQSRLGTPAPPIAGRQLSPLLTGYFATQFASRFVALLGTLLAVIALVTAVEMLDQVASKAHASMLVGLEMALLQLPDLAQEIMPFAVLFAAMATFWRLTRSNELVVARSAGVSIWQLQLPVLGVALLIGVITVTLVNPIGAVLLKRFDRLESIYTTHQPSSFTVGENGLWLRQVRDGDVDVIHAKRVSRTGATLHDVTIFRYAGPETFESRIDASKARLADGAWVLHDAQTAKPGAPVQTHATTRLKTSLTPDKIYNSFAPPETISFWELPGFIALLENAGFAAAPQKLQFHRLLAMPMLLAAMPLLAAAFTLRGHRQGRVTLLVVAGVLTGFVLHVLSNLVFAVGLSSHLPVVLAAWAPAGISFVAGLAALLYLEDG